MMVVGASGEPGISVSGWAIAEVRPRAIRDAPASMPQLISMAEHSRSKLRFSEAIVRLDAEYSN
jgi:hypothetical protein